MVSSIASIEKELLLYKEGYVVLILRIDKDFSFYFKSRNW